MTTQFNEEQFISFCGKGSIQQARRKLDKDGVDIHCKQRDTLNTAAHLAAMNDHLEVLRFLRESGFIFAVTGDELGNAEGDTPLHIACERNNFEIMLFLLVNNHPTTCRNNHNLKPGDSQIQARTFINLVLPQQKAFNALKPHHKTKLIEIFKDIDLDDMKLIDLHKAIRFNRYVQQNLAETIAQKDAKDFIKWTAICNKTTANLDEWLFAFSKLYVCDEPAFNKFIEDYDKALAAQGQLRLINI